MRFSKSVLIGILCMTLSGCGSSFQPKAPLPISGWTTEFTADLSDPTLFSAYHAMPDGQAKVDRRNQILTELMWLINQNYNAFESSFFVGQGKINFASTTLTMGLDMAGAVLGSAGTKAILAAVSGGVTGTQANYEKAFFDQATRNVIVEVMRSSRATQRNVIEAGMATCTTATVCGSSVISYSLEQGIQDLSSYYDAGTIIGALISISESSSQASAAAKLTLKGIRRQQ